MLKGPREFGLFLSTTWRDMYAHIMKNERKGNPTPCAVVIGCDPPVPLTSVARIRSEEHTSELQSREKLVCRLLPEKKKTGCSLPPETTTTALARNPYNNYSATAALTTHTSAR